MFCSGSNTSRSAADGSPLFDQTDQVTPEGFESELSAALVAEMIRAMNGEVAGKIQDPEVQVQMTLDEALIVVYATGDRDAVAALVTALEAGVVMDVGQNALLLEIAKTTNNGALIDALIGREGLSLEVIQALWDNEFFNNDKYEDYNRHYLMSMYGNPAEDLSKITGFMHLLTDDATIENLKRRCDEKKHPNDTDYVLTEGGPLFYLGADDGLLHIKFLSFDAVLEDSTDLEVLARNLQQEIFQTNRSLIKILVQVMQKLEQGLVTM